MTAFRPTTISLTAVFLFAAFAVGCGPKQSAPTPEPMLFPGADACSYPLSSPGKTYQRLGGGEWSASDPSDPASSFECVGSTNTVRTLNGDGQSIDVDYVATGQRNGASMITLSYFAAGSAPIANEATYRNTFINLAEIISNLSLGAQPHELFRKRIANLASYDPPGKDQFETYDVGKGFVMLGREASPDKLSIRITIKYYPDTVLKLKK